MFKPALLAVALTVSSPALAVQAFGSISFFGTDSYDATRITFTGPASIAGTSTGSFALLGNCFNCVAMTSFNYVGFTPTQLVSVTNMGSTLSFRLDSLTQVTRNSTGSLSIDGIGTVTQTGFDPTSGSFSLTSQGGGDGVRNVTFSSSLQSPASAIPEIATWAMMLVGFGTIGATLRRRRSSCVTA